MALITPFRDEGAAGEVLAVAERHFERSLITLDALVSEVEQRAAGGGPEIKRAAQDLRAAMQALFDERKRLETVRNREAGLVHGFAFDLDAARLEVGGLLDRLRAARGAGGVS
jgi:hypothetical protein